MERISVFITKKKFLELNMSASVKFKIFIKCNNKNYNLLYKKIYTKSLFTFIALIWLNRFYKSYNKKKLFI